MITYNLFQEFLKFPANNSVSSSAKDLIQGLLSDPVSRLKYDQIRVHGFFMDIDFDNIRQSKDFSLFLYFFIYSH